MLRKIRTGLIQQGYRPVSPDDEMVLVKDYGNSYGLVRLTSDRAVGRRGFSRVSLQDSMRRLERSIMVRTAKPCYSLLLVFTESLPSMDLIDDFASMENAWIIDQADRRLMIFENQIDDFYGLRAFIEYSLDQWSQEKTGTQAKEWKQFLAPVNLSMILINIIVFLVLSFLGDTLDPVFMAGHGANSWAQVVGNGEYWRLLTSGFLHFGPEHLFHNMAALLFIGSNLENSRGHVTYFAVYMASEFVSALTSLFVTLASDHYAVSAGASGAVFGVIGAVIAGAIFDAFLVGRKGGKVGRVSFLVMLAFALVMGMTSPGVDMAAHAGGLVTGFLLMTAITLIRKAVEVLTA